MGYVYGKRWTDELICFELKETMRILGIETMPTHSQIVEVYGNEGLTNALVHHGGTKKFANLLGIDTKACESKFGDKYEVLCMQEIANRYGYETLKMKPRYPYDILVENSVKVDTKASRLYTSWKSKTSFYTFNLEKRSPTCDIFVCYCINNVDQIIKTFVIPACAVSGNTQLSVGVIRGKYDIYVDGWDLIKEYVEFNKSHIKH